MPPGSGDVNRGIGLELFEAQDAIIRLQSEAIRELYGLLSQYMGADEIGRLPGAGKADRAAEVKRLHGL